MNNMSSQQPILNYTLPRATMGDPRARAQAQSQALEDLISVLEMAAVQMGWIYRPSVRDSSNLLSQTARLRAAHAAYALASAHIQRNTLGKSSPGPNAILSSTSRQANSQELPQ